MMKNNIASDDDDDDDEDYDPIQTLHDTLAKYKTMREFSNAKNASIAKIQTINAKIDESRDVWDTMLGEMQGAMNKLQAQGAVQKGTDSASQDYTAIYYAQQALKALFSQQVRKSKAKVGDKTLRELLPRARELLESRSTVGDRQRKEKKILKIKMNAEKNFLDGLEKEKNAKKKRK